uniref:Ig-like domain-containing protein n=1 Tax=Schistosoma mansoni TaxID=6183 RepID=A0A3Q0KTG1_SCHMA
MIVLKAKDTLPSEQNHTIVLLDLKSGNNNLSIHHYLSNIIQSMINKQDSFEQNHYIKTGSIITIDCIVFSIKNKFRNELFNLIKQPIHQQPVNRHLKRLYYTDCALINNKSDLYGIHCNYLSFKQKITNNKNELNEYNKFPYKQIDIFRYTIYQVNNSFNGRWICYSDDDNNKSSKVHNLIISDSQDSEVQSHIHTPTPSTTSVHVKCDYTLSSNVTNITELHKNNSNEHNKNLMNVKTINWELLLNPFDQLKLNAKNKRNGFVHDEGIDLFTPKINRFTDPEVSKRKIDCQITGQQQRRDKRQVDYDVYYPSKSVRLDTNLSPDYFVQVGTILEIKCTAEPGNPPPKLSLLRQRFDESKATVIQTKTKHLSQSNSFMNTHKDITQEFMVTLSEEDNGASFFCEVTSTGIKSSKARSDSVRYNVSFPPRAVYVQSYPEGLIAESSQKMFSCQTDSMGSNPPAILKWQQLDSAGAIISLETLKMSVTVDFITQSNGAVVTRSNLTVLASRALNGRRFECSVVFNDSKTLLRSEGFLEVMFSPNNIRLTAQPINGVPEAGRLELTCATSSCHPPAVIRWLEIPPDKIQEKNKNIEEHFQYNKLFSNELTDLAQLETNQGDFGGTKVLSTLIITKTYRSHQNTIYQCLVNHTGMNKPVLSEHRLQILYPPSIHIISLPNQPIARQSVILFCQAIGGNPSNDLTYAWFVAKSTQFSSLLKQDDDTQLNDDQYEEDTDNSLNLSSLKNHFISSSLVTQRPEFDSMIQLSGYHDSQLNLTNIKLSQAGWYGCEVSGIGGSSHALHHLDLYYQPVMNRRTQTHVMVQLGESVTLALYVDANPPWAEAEWFQINTFKDEAGKMHNSEQYVEPQAYFEPPQINYGYPQSYDSWPRVRRTIFNRFESHLSTSDFSGEQNLRQSIGQRKNIFASSGTGLYGNLTFFLRFTEVKSVDFGTYVCQVRHQLGVKEFTFHLIKKAGAEVITEESIEVIHHGPTTSILFSPPLKSSLMKLILRVCRRDAFLGNHKQIDKQSVSKQHFKRDIPQQKVSITSKNVSNQNDVASRLDSSQISANSRTVGCEDYQVAKPWLGKMEIHLSDAVQLYNFRFLLFQGTKLLQETSPVLWQPEISKTRGVFNKSLLALAASGGCALVIVFLITIIIIYSCYGRNKHDSLKFWNIKKSLKSSTSQQSSKNLDVPNHIGCELGFELHSDLGSVRRYQPETPYKQPPPSGSFISNGYDNSLNGIHHFNSLQNSAINGGLDGHSIDNECAALLHSRNSVASSQSAHMNMINSRIFAEAYAAAARAAASLVSGSTDIYSPSSQVTNDLSSQNNEERNRSQHSLLYSMNQEINNGFINGSKEANINTENTGGWKKYNNSNSSICLKNRDKRKANEISKYKNSLQGIRKHSRISLSGQLEPRGSHLSVQMPSKHSLNYSQWSNASGASYSSLVSPSQTDLQVAAQVAAAAAVVSVVENMNLSLAMNHASSLNNVGNYCLMPRPASRAASVTGPTTRNINKLWMENEDGESMKLGLFTPRNASTGQATPTASVDTVDPNLQISTPSPISQQQQYSNDVNNNNNRNQLSLNNQQINGSFISQFNAVPQTKLDDRYHQNYNPNRSADSQNISNLYAYQQQQMYPIHGPRGPYSTFISPTSQTNISSPSNLSGNEQNPSLMAYYRILAQNQMLNRHKLQQFHQYQLIQQQQHQRQQQQQHGKNDQSKQTFNMNRLHQQINGSKNFISDQKDQKNNLENCTQPNQEVEPKKDLKSIQINKIVSECVDKQLDPVNSNKFQDQDIQKSVNKHEENSSINQKDEHDRSLIMNPDLNEINQTINLDNAQSNIPKQVLTTEINTCHKTTDQISSNETPSLLLNDRQMINPTDINNENTPNNKNFNQPLTVTITSDPYYNSVTNHNIYYKYSEHQSPPLNNTEYNEHKFNDNNCHIHSSKQSQSSIYSQNTSQSPASPPSQPLQSTQQSKQQPRLGIHSPIRTNRYLNSTEQSAFKQVGMNQEKLSLSNDIKLSIPNDNKSADNYLSNEINIHSNSIA